MLYTFCTYDQYLVTINTNALDFYQNILLLFRVFEVNKLEILHSSSSLTTIYICRNALSVTYNLHVLQLQFIR